MPNEQLDSSKSLERDGDALERQTWGEIKLLFPHYEEFWRTHLVPLRAAGSIYPRRGIDEDFEFLAMLHYSTYVHICRARDKSSDATNVSRFPDEIYIHLYGAAELAGKLVDRFSNLYTKCTGKIPTLTSGRIPELEDRFRRYRNLVHDQISAVTVDEANRLRIPKPDKLERYQKWTAVLYDAREDDFVDASVQIHTDSQSLYSALEDVWKGMCKLSVELARNRTYLELRSKGDSPTRASVMAGLASGAQVRSSVAVSAVIVSSATNRNFG